MPQLYCCVQPHRAVLRGPQCACAIEETSVEALQVGRLSAMEATIPFAFARLYTCLNLRLALSRESLGHVTPSTGKVLSPLNFAHFAVALSRRNTHLVPYALADVDHGVIIHERDAVCCSGKGAMSSDYLPQLDYGQSSDDAVAGSAAATQAADETTTVAGLDSSLLDTLLRRFTAVDFSNEPVGNNSGAGAAPTQRAASTASQAAALAGSGGPVKSALKNRSRGGAKAVDPVKAAAAAAAAEQDARLAAANRAAAVAREQAREARASAALRGVEWMLDNTASSEAELRAHALGALTAAEFAEATQERALASVCGNPLCSNALTRPADVGAMRLSSSKKVAYRVQAPVFCGPACALRARDIQVRVLLCQLRLSWRALTSACLVCHIGYTTTGNIPG